MVKVYENEKDIWITQQSLAACDISTNGMVVKHIEGINYYLMDKNKIKYDIDNKQATLDIYHQDYLNKQQIQLNNLSRKKIRPKQSGVFLNYSVTAQEDNVSDLRSTSAFTSLNYFNHYGVGHTDTLFQNIGGQNKAIRLETNWTVDEPENVSSWRFGDSITGTDIWTGAVRFGGIQYASNFATQPGFVTFPLPAVEGLATVPTSVDFYLNNQLINSQQVTPGAFDIQGLPVITGAGNVLVQTKDITGKQTVVSVPYYTSPTLLKPGLSDYSYELGTIRNNYGINSNDYSHLLGVLTYKKGLSENLTSGIHTEIMGEQQNIGLSSAYILNKFAVVNAAAAISNQHKGSGGLLLAGIQRQTPHYSLGFQAETASKYFWQLGLDDDALAPKLTLQSSASVNMAHYGSLSVSYTNRVGRTEPNIALATLGYSKNLRKGLFLNINLLKQYGSTHDNELYIGLVYTPAPSYTASASYNNSFGRENQGTFEFSKNLPTDTGIGYHLLQAAGKDTETQASLLAQWDHGQYQARYSHIDNTDNYELNANGALVLFANQLNMTREITDSFALVDLSGEKNIPVYFSNQPISKSNAHGYVFVPNIRAYQNNTISIDPDDLPINTQISQSQINIEPYLHSGTYVKFPIQEVNYIEFNLVDSHMNSIPAGSSVKIDGLEKTFPVGYDGQMFLTITKELPLLKGTVYSPDNQTCYFEIRNKNKQVAYTQLGVVKCV